VKRGFWVALGLGAGAASAVIVSRWTKKQARRVAPSAIAREAKGGLFELGKLVSESLAEGKRAMEEREAQLRGELGVAPQATVDRSDAPPSDPLPEASPGETPAA
jgi:hypothetical protein